MYSRPASDRTTPTAELKAGFATQLYRLRQFIELATKHWDEAAQPFLLAQIVNGEALQFALEKGHFSQGGFVRCQIVVVARQQIAALTGFRVANGDIQIFDCRDYGVGLLRPRSGRASSSELFPGDAPDQQQQADQCSEDQSIAAGDEASSHALRNLPPPGKSARTPAFRISAIYPKCNRQAYVRRSPNLVAATLRLTKVACGWVGKGIALLLRLSTVTAGPTR